MKRTIPTASRFARRPAAALGAFRRAEDGSMVIFSLFLLMVMLIIGGMAVDLMRFEATRSRLQSTLDRAVLAAADLDQTLDAQGVVEDYFAKADLLDQLTYVEVVESINSKQVRATAAMDMNTFFMDMLGFPRLTAPAAGTAIESVSDIEIILVLDVSGSMKDNNRLPNLQDAAEEFVTSMFADDAENRISIGIVPFNGQINLGPVLRARYNATDLHGVTNVNCIDLPPAAFASPDLSTMLPMPMTAHADTFSTTTTSNAYYQINANAPAMTNVWCPPSTANIVMPPTRSESNLISRINSFTAVGATSINAGMRWGIELLDPGSRPMFGVLANLGAIPAYFSDRPFDYERDDTLKVIVLMSDGENFAEERVNAGYRANTPSPIWRASSDGYLSIFHDSRVDGRTSTTICNSRPYWVPHRSQWQSRPWNGTSPASNACYNPTATVNGTAQQTWQQVWSYVRMSWVAWQMYGRPLSTTSTGRLAIYNDMMDTFRTRTEIADMNTQLQDMCEMAQDSGVVVFTIAFEAPQNGRDQLSLCASSPNHYFNAQGLEISSAFRAIAAQINRLRLIE